MEEAAKTLKAHIFDFPYNPVKAPGMIGMGTTELYVYMHCPRGQWRGKMPLEWQGIPVRWRFSVGRAVVG